MMYYNSCGSAHTNLLQRFVKSKSTNLYNSQARNMTMISAHGKINGDIYKQ